MPAWIYVLAVAAVGFVLFVAVFHPFRRGAHAALRALPVTRVDLPAVGSMSLADEQAWLTAPLAPPWPVESSQQGDRTGEGVRVRANESRPAARADLTGPLIPRPQQEGPGLAARAGTGALGPYGGQLGPRAQLVWDRWDARCRERWGFSPS